MNRRKSIAVEEDGDYPAMIDKNELAYKTESRAHALILAAYHIIAERGFEGLRLRDVADQVGINHATLHHYFPTKEDLVRAVVLYVTQSLGETSVSTEGTPLDQLCTHLRLLKLRMQEEPALFVALNEIEQRALRDPAIRAVTQARREMWRTFLVSLLKAGIEQGDWPKDLDAEAVSFAIVALMSSISVRLSPEGAEQAMQQLERWLFGSFQSLSRAEKDVASAPSYEKQYRDEN